MTEKNHVYLSKKKLNYKKNYPTYRPMENVPCFRKQDIFFVALQQIFWVSKYLGNLQYAENMQYPRVTQIHSLGDL